MKIIVISDTHGNITNLRHVIGFAEKIKASGIIHCGDWDNSVSVNEVLQTDIPLYSILGNADTDYDIEEVLKFNAKEFDSDFLKFEIDGRRIGIIHNIKNFKFKTENLDVVFTGHYHSQEEKMINFTKLIRPGALINGINFAVYETTNNTVEFFNDEVES